jgi:hypothetical protein
MNCRLHALHAQVQLQLRSQPCIDLQLFVSFMQLLGRATWSTGPTVTDNRSAAATIGFPQPFGTAGGQQQVQQQQQHPMHVACSVCGLRPIVGVRLRSRTQFGFNVCMGCAGSQEAAAAGPLEEVSCEYCRKTGSSAGCCEMPACLFCACFVLFCMCK